MYFQDIRTHCTLRAALFNDGLCNHIYKDLIKIIVICCGSNDVIKIAWSESDYMKRLNFDLHI